MSRPTVTATENLCTPRRTPSTGARHSETALATEATAKAMVNKNRATDHVVTNPNLSIRSLTLMTTTLTDPTRLSTATRGHTRIPRSTVLLRRLLRPPIIQNGAYTKT